MQTRTTRKWLVHGQATVSVSVIVEAETADEAVEMASDTDGVEFSEDGEPDWERAEEYGVST